MNYETLIHEQEQELAGLTLDQVGRLRGVFVEARTDLEKRLAKLEARGRGERWTADQSRQALVQIESAAASIEARLGSVTTGAGVAAQESQVGHLVAQIEAARSEFDATDLRRIDVKTLVKLTEPNGTLLEKKAKAGAKLWTKETIGQAKGILARGVATGRSIGEMVSDLTDRNGGPLTGEGARGRALRLVRTEMIDAYSERRMTAMEEAAGEVEGLMKRLVNVFDARTAIDTLLIAAVPGNLARKVDEAFEDPYFGRTFMRPPSRPNDRAAIAFWMEAWGLGPDRERIKAWKVLEVRSGKLRADVKGEARVKVLIEGLKERQRGA